MAQTVLRCPANMPVDLIAAWHDHTLNADQTANVSAHVASCPACQGYLNDYAQDDTALRRAEAPALQELIWRGVRADIAQSPQRRAGLPRNAVLGGLGAALAVTLLFAALFVFVLDNKGTTRSISVAATASVTATDTVIPTPTVTPLQVSPSQGWVMDASLTYGKDIAFSQSDPLTGYACGNAGNAGVGSDPLILGVTHDGGRTWQGPLPTPTTGAICKIYINPLNPQEFILEGGSCWQMCGDGISADYRSRDSGQTWVKLTLPPGDEPTVNIEYPVWAGGNLFVLAYHNSGVANPIPLLHGIAESINGGALVWVNQSGLPADPNELDEFACAFAIGSTYYTCSTPTGISPLTTLFKTSDNGATWTRIVFKADAPLSPFITVGGDGKTLFASSERSIDGGLTWKTLPPVQGEVLDSAPDGTVYAEYSNANSVFTFIKLLPGSQTWSAVASGYFSPDTLSWDISGHPVALWAGKSSANGMVLPGIAYHAA